MITRPDQRWLLEVVGRIYDCALDRSKWPLVLGELMSAFRLHNAALSFHGLHRGQRTEVQVSLGVPEEYAHLPHLYPEAVLQLWGGTARIMATPLEEPIIQSEQTTAEAMEENTYFQSFAVPQGIIDAVAVGLARDEHRVATLAAGRHRSAGPFERYEIDGLRLLAPHLRRAVIIGGLFDEQAAAAATLSEALDATPAAVVLVDAEMAVVHANSKAQRLLLEEDTIRVRVGALGLAAEVVPGALANAVASAAGGDAEVGRKGISIPALRADGAPALVSVLPLKGRTTSMGVPLRGRAAIFISSSTGRPSLPAEALAHIFGLTPAEVRVFELAVEGTSAKAIATRLGIAASTARTHLACLWKDWRSQENRFDGPSCSVASRLVSHLIQPQLHRPLQRAAP
jgi:DNA-binding CsgD family transcriptional regulator/PAS domain-containing protein